MMPPFPLGGDSPQEPERIDPVPPDEPSDEDSRDFPEQSSVDLTDSLVLPWYFRFIWVFANLVMVGSAFLFGVSIIFLALTFFSSAQTFERAANVAAAMAWTVSGLVVVLACALILLVHDMAVSFRSLRNLPNQSQRHAEALRKALRRDREGPNP